MIELKPKEYVIEYVFDACDNITVAVITYRANYMMEKSVRFTYAEHWHQFEDLLKEAGYKSAKLCKCGKNPASEPHPCPYQSDLHNDPSFMCVCCDKCIGECARDVQKDITMEVHPLLWFVGALVAMVFLMCLVPENKPPTETVNGKTVISPTVAGGVAGFQIRRVKLDGHVYIVFDWSNQGGVTHDPDCSCTKR